MRAMIALLSGLALALACSGGGAPEPTEDPTDVLAVQPIPEPPPHAEEGEPPPEREDADTEVALDPVEAYLRDCHYVVPPDPSLENFDREMDECLFREFDQNCAPDMFGCYGAGEECRTACGQPCVTCQSDCANSCETCKERCTDKDEDCLLACALARAVCRDGCLEGRSTCEAGCGTAESACYEEAEAEKVRKCPHCDEIRACLVQSNLDIDACQAKFPEDEPECGGWCGPWD